MKNLFKDTDYQNLVNRTKLLQPDSKARWGKMNSGQVLCHLSDALRDAQGTRPSKPLGNFLFHTLFKWLALYALPWPKGKLPTAPEYDQQKKGSQPVDFINDRDAFLELLKTTRTTTALSSHPAFGKLTKNEWGRVLYLHVDHHLKQFGC